VLPSDKRGSVIRSSALTDAGRSRQTNEDCYLLNDRLGLFVLADGMGGHASGEVASELASRTIEDFLKAVDERRELTWPFGYEVKNPYEHNVLRTAFKLANVKVRQAAAQELKWSGMGCTIVAAWVRENGCFYSYVGDSRLYLLRQGQLRQLSHDHTLVAEQVRLGLISPEEAKVHELRHVVTRAIGGRERLEVDVNQERLLPHDVLALFSDGITDELTDSEICGILFAERTLDERCRQLVDAANEAGGEDNLTVVLLENQP